jgi:transposase
MQHVAIDLGGRESQICIRSGTGEILKEQRIRTAKLAAFFKTLEQSRIVVETCAEAFSVAVSAEEAGHEVRVVPATLVKALGVGSRGIKTDIRDARCLSEASARMENLPSVHLPSKVSREVKAACGMRECLVESRTKLINSVRGWLRGQIISLRGGGTETFPDRVRAKFVELDLALPVMVERQLAVIEVLTTQIKEADKELKAIATKDERCRRLMSVPGVGSIVGLRFLAAVDEVARFDDAHHLQSYFGLTPGENSSSDARRRTHLTRAGSAQVRWTLIQAAWSAMRSRPLDPMVLWATEIKKRRGSSIAATALARKLAGILFALLRNGSTYDAARASTIRAENLEPNPPLSAKRVLREARASAAND